MDKIFLNDMEFYGYHGVLPEENKLGQRFIVTVMTEADLSIASRSDSIHDTIDYSLLYTKIKNIVEGPPRKLLEKLAEDIATELLENFPIIERITVKVVKPNPPIHGHYHSVAIEIVRER